MGNLKQNIYLQLSQDPSILSLLYDASLSSFTNDDLNTKEKNKNKIDIKIKSKKNKDSNSNHIFEMDDVNIQTVSSDMPLAINIHGEAIKNSLFKMKNFQLIFDPSIASSTPWIESINKQVFDVSAWIDVSAWVPENQIIKILYNDASCRYDSSFGLYILDLDFTFINNTEKVKK